MNKNKKTFLLSIAAAALGAAATAHAETEAAAPAAEKEKCYGVADAGANDCAVEGKHSCAGAATTAGDANEWVFVPKGLCDRLATGSLTPGAADEGDGKKG
jgi:uncharacterized membrane protein